MTDKSIKQISYATIIAQESLEQVVNFLERSFGWNKETSKLLSVELPVINEGLKFNGVTMTHDKQIVGAILLFHQGYSCVSDDRGDGTYIISFTAAVVGETRVIVRLDNVEMQPLRMVFVEQKEAHAVSTDVTTKRAKSKSGAQDRVIEESQPNATAPTAAAAVATNLSTID